MTSLQGRHAIITGASRGIGAAIAERLANDGATLTLLARTVDALHDISQRLAPIAKVQTFACDVTKPEQIVTAFQSARASFGLIDILVNNAGQADSAAFLKTSLEQWRYMLDLNLTGTFLCSQAALPDMLASGAGRIVNVASIAGLRGHPYIAAYSASKHGVIGLTRSLALEVAKRGITVNAVCPGYTDTDIVHDGIARIVEKTGLSEAQALAEMVKTNPQGRLITPVEVADAVAWLCYDAAASINGLSIPIAGGEVT